MDASKRILVTGANGFIGSHLMKELVNQGVDVGMIKRENSDTWRIDEILSEMQVFNSDITDYHNVQRIFKEFSPNTVIHLATYYVNEHKPNDIKKMIDTNLTGTANLLEASVNTDVETFINTSSCFVYSRNLEKHSETDEVEPINLYGVIKQNAENLCDFFSKEYGIKTVTLRLFPPYGPFDHERRLIPYVISSFSEGKRLDMTTGRQKWDFVFIDDIIDAYSKVISGSFRPGKHEIFNIGTGSPVSVRDIVSLIKHSLKSNSEIVWGGIPHRKNEVWHSVADTRKAEQELGWKSKTNIKQGIEKTVNWYKHKV